MDSEFNNFSLVRGIINDNNDFFIMFNKFKGELGLYIIKVKMNNPIIRSKTNPNKDELNGQLILNYRTGLEIGDAEINLLESHLGYRELVVSFKTIFINIFTVMIIDM